MPLDSRSYETVTPRFIPTPLEARPGIREASLKDYDGIVALQLRNGLSPRSYEEWAALWTENPAYAKSSERPPVGWVVEEPDGKIVGYLGNLPLAYHLNGRDLRAATVYSWAVDAPYRGHSLRLLDLFLKQKNVDLIVCSTVNAPSAKAYRAFQFAKAPSGKWDRSGFWITGYRGFARAALRAFSMPLAGLFSYPVAAGLFLRDLFSYPPRPSRGAKFQLCPSFDARFDRFWDDLKQENHGKLLAVRDRETLEWHFRRALAEKNLWILAASRGWRMVAYAVFDRQDHPPSGLKRIRIADFQALSGFEELLRPMLGWALEKCRRKDIHIAEHPGCWLDALRVPGTAAPHHRKLKAWVFYYRASEKDLSRQLNLPGVWVPSTFDGDASL